VVAVKGAPGDAFARATGALRPLDEAAMQAARDRHLTLTKPPGSLGRLEDVGVQLAGIAGRCPPPTPAPAAIAVFAADHGVVAQGVTPWPQDVTAQMVANFATGGAAINVLAGQVGATVHVVDVGVASELAVPAHGAHAVRHHKVRAGTGDLAVGPAMSIDDARRALDVGAHVAHDLVRGGARLLVTGDMGIGNTTASAALVAALTGAPAGDVTGRGTGVDDATLARKAAVVARAVERAATHEEPLAVLAEVGGLEVAAIAGFVVGGAAAGVPVVVDGLIAAAGTLAAARLAPGVEARCVAGHRSPEPGATVALEALGLAPLLDLGLRLGEGTGACLAVPLVQAAARVLAEMATFAEAQVSGVVGPAADPPDGGRSDV
jgi:nicotinate-nucleotide--dimethylbenzimidazole phosphoribosyltransferase